MNVLGWKPTLFLLTVTALLNSASTLATSCRPEDMILAQVDAVFSVIPM